MVYIPSMTVKQAAKELNTNEDEVKRLCRIGQLETVDIPDFLPEVSVRSVKSMLGEDFEEDVSGIGVGETEAFEEDEVPEHVEPVILSQQETADILGLSEGSIYNYGCTGKLRRLGSGYDKESVMAYKAKRDEHKKSGMGGTIAADVARATKKAEPNAIPVKKEDIEKLNGGKVKVKPLSEPNVRTDELPFELPPRTYSEDDMKEALELAFMKGKLAAFESMSEFKRRT